MRTGTLAPYRLLEVNPEGSVPVVKDGETGEWFTDSAKFVDYLEDKQPEPALGKSSDAPEAGSQVFPKFVAAIKAPPADKSKLEPVVEVGQQGLYSQLQQLLNPSFTFRTVCYGSSAPSTELVLCASHLNSAYTRQRVVVMCYHSHLSQSQELAASEYCMLEAAEQAKRKC